MSPTRTQLTDDRARPDKRTGVRFLGVDRPREFFSTLGLALGVLLMALFYLEIAFGSLVSSQWIGAFAFGVIGGPLLLLSVCLHRTWARVLIALPGLATLGWFWAYIAVSL